MKLYEEGAFNPPGQNKMFEKIIRAMEKNLPGHLSLRINGTDFEYKSMNVKDEKNRTYLHIRCYKKSGFPRQWRMKLMTQEEKGEKFLKEFFVPLIESIPDK